MGSNPTLPTKEFKETGTSFYSFKYASVAQIMVERGPEEPCVTGSNPVGSTYMALWTSGKSPPSHGRSIVLIRIVSKVLMPPWRAVES